MLAALLALAPGAHAAATGDLYLNSDGNLADAPQGPPQACLSLEPTGPSTVAKGFRATLDPDPFGVRLDAQTASLLLDLGPNPAAGSGFTLRADLDVAGTTASDTLAVAGGTSVPTPLRLALTLPPGNGTGFALLSLTLSKTGAGPVSAGQSVAILCGDEGSRLSSLSFTPASGEPDDAADGGEAAGGGLSAPAILTIALLAGLVTLVAGALAISGRTISQRRIHLLLGATAGLLLAVAVLDLVPEAVELSDKAPYTIVAGLLALFLVRHFAGGHGHGEGAHETGEEHHAHSVATHAAGLAAITFFALGFHRFVDGLVLPAAFELDSAIGLAAATAVLIHQFPDGIAAASLFLAAGWHRRKVLLGVLVMALLTPVGSVAGLFLLGQDALVGHLIALAAATFIFIPLAELLPELRAREHRWPVGIGFAAGYLVAFAIVIVPGLLGFEA